MLKVIIFDMNGVIINDEKFHLESWKVFCKKYNFKLSDQEFKDKTMGRTDKETFEYLFGKKLTSEEVNKYGDERDKIARNLVEGKLKLTRGLMNFLEELKNENIRLAIATSSRKNYMNFIVDTFDIRKYFDYIITAEDIFNGKPDPEIYLKAASLLNISPQECLVFEDSLSGIRAAKTAGMKVVGITTTHSKKELNLADKVIDNFFKISLSDLKSLNS